MTADEAQLALEDAAKHLRLDGRRQVGEEVYDALKHAIVTLRLRPGASISESSICRSTGVSRTPVRAAIGRLTEEGLIDVFPQRGSFVSLISLKSIKDSHFVRRTLELALMKEAARHWTPATSAALRASLERQRAAVAAGDDDLFFDEDEQFHALFAHHAGLPGAWATVLGMRTRLIRFYRLFAQPERLRVVVDEHRAVVDALDRGDVAAAEACLLEHVDKVFEMLRAVPEVYGRYLTD